MASGRSRGRSQDYQDTDEWRARRRQYQELQQKHRTEFRSTAELEVGNVMAWPDSSAVTLLEKKPGSTRGKTFLRTNLPVDESGEFDDGERCWLVFIGAKGDTAAPARGRRTRPERGRRARP